MGLGPTEGVSLSDNLAFRRLRQGNAVLVFDVSQAFEVDDIGMAVLEWLRSSSDVAALVETLAADYGVPREVVAEDVSAFLGDCASLGIVRTAGNGC